MARNRILPIFVPHLGCPCTCVFCNQRTIAGQSRAATPEKVRAVMQQAQNQAPYEIAFYGGSFTAIPPAEQEALLSAALEGKKSGQVSAIRVSTRPDCVDDEAIKRLQRFGVQTVELGAQSFCDHVLQVSQRGHTARETDLAVMRLQKNGVSVIIQLMAGLPGDCAACCRESAEHAAALRPDGVRIYPVAVLPDTELYKMWRAGEYEPLTVPQAAEWCADMLEVFERERVPVIRIGLNPTEELGAQVVAGAYHPAMGEIVKSRLYYRRMSAMLMPYCGQAGHAVFTVPDRMISQAVGQARYNLLQLSHDFPGIKISICGGNDVMVLSFTPTEI